MKPKQRVFGTSRAYITLLMDQGPLKKYVKAIISNLGVKMVLKAD